METWLIFVSLVGGYLVGSISFTCLVTWIVAPKTDLTNVEIPTSDGGTFRLRAFGATTASIKLGPKVGFTIGILDILKAFLPILRLHWLYPSTYYHLFAGVAVVAGHIWPIFYCFKGGWGILPIYGYLRDRRAGKVDMQLAMNATPMGRGFKKMAIFLGIEKKESVYTP